VLAADGILLGSPVYFGDITTNTKALMERVACRARERRSAQAESRRGRGGRPAGGAMHTLNSLNHFFTIGQMIIVAPATGTSESAGGGPGREGRRGHADHADPGENMAWVLKKLKPDRLDPVRRLGFRSSSGIFDRTVSTT